ncbi:uncharacterized protein TRIADDRAFT_58762 [Trichoplax adhaerens]|uniref:Macro domain-containing protein n=1 Tax=Trichoplax adhaerens TaxID=10228 RepID=B3S3L1_TRIAD|nr:predicted protein [Trichoplax adhaerens]EDV22816.1 predicted protein [Trichoplax adhaerens]|eukprot:XP_002114682.1 predicted protein [Trichoplax adhaerens]
MASSSLESHTIYACGIESRFVKDFEEIVIQLAPDVQIGNFNTYICSAKKNWNFVELCLFSEGDCVTLMAKLRGLKIKESKIPLRLFWPVELVNYKRKQLTNEVFKQMAQLGRKAKGCFFDIRIEDRQVTYFSEADAIIALLCLDGFEFLTCQPIIVQFESQNSEALYDEVFRIRNLLENRQDNSNRSASHYHDGARFPVKQKKKYTSGGEKQPFSLNSCFDPSLSSKQLQVKNPFVNDGINHRDKVAQDRKEQKTSKGVNFNKSQGTRTTRSKPVTDGTGVENYDSARKVQGKSIKAYLNENKGSHQSIEQNSGLSNNVQPTHGKPLSMKQQRANGNDSTEFSTLAKNMIEEEYPFSKKAYILIQKLNLEQRIRDKGFEISFTFREDEDGGLLSARMIDGDQGSILKELMNFFNWVDSKEDLSDRLCNYLAIKTDMMDLLNKKFNDHDIDGAIVHTEENTSISIIAKNMAVYYKVKALLLQAFSTKTTIISYENRFFSKDTHLFLSSIEEDIPACSNVLLEANLDKDTNTCSIAVTGPNNIVESVIQAIETKIDNYKLIKFVISDIPVLKTEYLRMHLHGDILSSEKKYGCQIKIEEKQGSDSWCMDVRKNISVECCNIHETTISNEIQALLQNITTEEGHRISKYSYIGRLFSNSKHKAKLERLQGQLQCLITMTYDNERFTAVIKYKMMIKIVLNVNKFRESNESKPMVEKSVTLDQKVILQTAKQEEVITAKTAAPSDSTQPVSLTSSNERQINNVAIKLVQGRLEQEGAASADVIISSMSLNNFAEGKIAKALSAAGGAAYQQECSSLLQSLSINSIGCTNGQYFGCKKVYHIAFLSSDKSTSWLSQRIEDCLKKADNESMQSIAIPIIGTGSINLNIDEITKEMIKVAMDFAHKHTGSLQEIYFIVFPTDLNVYSAMKQSLESSKVLEVQLKQQAKLVKKVIKSTGNTPTHVNLSGTQKLLFSARCEITETPICINIYDGNIHDVAADAIVDITSLCPKHSKVDSHLDFIHYNDAGHTSQTLRKLSSKSRSTIYQVCPYGCLSGFSTILAIINAREEKSIAIPLLSHEMDFTHVYSLIDTIEIFIANNLSAATCINCFNFVIGYKDRSREFASWMQMVIVDKPLQFGWQITQHVAVKELGFNVTYVAKDKSIITKMESEMEELTDAWTSHKMTEEDYFDSVDQNSWSELALQFWSEYNTILVKQGQDKTVYIYGFENDILNAVSSIHKLSKTYFEEKAQNEVEKVTAETAKWYVKAEESKAYFGVKLNYEIEKNYKIYTKDKTKKTFVIDAGNKTIDFGEMNLKFVDGTEYPIGKSSITGVAKY